MNPADAAAPFALRSNAGLGRWWRNKEMVMGFDEWWESHDLALQEYPRRLANAAWNGGIDIAREDAADGLRNWPMADFLLHCGEMTAQEQRCVRAALDYLAGRMRHVPLRGQDGCAAGPARGE